MAASTIAARRLIPAPLAGGVLVCFTCLVVGVSLPVAALAQPIDEKINLDSSLDELMIDIRFDGGTAGAYLDLVSRQCKPLPFNYIVRGGAENVMLQPFHLRQVDVPTALEVVLAGMHTRDEVANPAPGLVQARVEVEQIGSVTGSNSAVVFQITRKDSINPNMSEENPLGRPGSAPSQHTEVLSLRDITHPPGEFADFADTSLSVDDVMQSMHGAMMFAAAGKEQHDGVELDMQYHPESGMLIVRATPEQLNIAKHIHMQMQRDLVLQRDQHIKLVQGEQRLVELRAQYRAMDDHAALISQSIMQVQDDLGKYDVQLLEDQNNERLLFTIQMAQKQLNNLEAERSALASQRSHIEADMMTLEAMNHEMQSHARTNASRVQYATRSLEPFADQIASVLALATNDRAHAEWDSVSNALIVDASAKDQKLAVELLALLQRVRSNQPEKELGDDWHRPANNGGR